MKLPIACAVSIALGGLAHAEPDPGMQLMTAMMRCPAMSSDGKHVAIYSDDPGAEKDSMTSLAVFDGAGKLEQRISVVPPNTDEARAKTAAAKVVKLLDAGGYKRMSRVARVSEKATKTTYATKLESEDVEIELGVANRKLTIHATRAGKRLVAVTRTFGAKDGRCKSVDAYGLSNTMAGYDAKSGELAFSITVQEGDQICFSHDFVVVLK